MTDYYFDPQAFSSIANTLDEGAKGLDGLSNSTPNKIDAGLMTAVVSSMLAQVVTSAANVSSVLAASADAVTEAWAYYARADADQAASLDQIHKAMQK